MFTEIRSLFSALLCAFRSRLALQAEIIALRHQLVVFQRKNSGRRIQLRVWDRILWVWLSRLWTGWPSALLIVKPETVIAWHRRGLKLYRTWKSRHPSGRPSVPVEVRDLIRRMSLANPRWGAPRISGELLKIGINLSETTIAKYMARHRKPPSQTWRTFLKNHMTSLVSADFFVVPTITFQLYFVFVIVSHDRRRPIHFAVTKSPTADWTARQLREAFPWDSAPRYLLRDRDGVYGQAFSDTAESLGIREVLTAPQSPWQNPHVERFIGSIRRECLDHVIIINRTGLHRILKRYFDYYECSRTHLSLAKDAPIPRPVQTPSAGKVVEIPLVGGLHHRYERRAA
jgi:putative transposase